MTRARLVTGCALILVVLTGCSPTPADEDASPAVDGQPAGDAAAPEIEPVPVESVTVTPIRDASALKAAIAQHQGETVLVNFWATWCPPCVAEFPSLVRLRDAYADQGLVLLTVSGDDPGAIDDTIKPFLAKHGVKDDAYVLDIDDTPAFIDQFNGLWEGAFPASFVYGPDGDLKAQVTGEHSYEEFEALVRPHLPQGG